MGYFLGAVVALVLVMDPFGNMPIFIASLKKVAPERRMFVLVRELCIALAIMITFMFAGNAFLRVMEIENYALTVSGGLVLFLISIKLVFGGEEDSSADPKDEEPFIVPLAIPLVAGPAALTFTIFYATQIPNRWIMLGVVLSASAINMIILMLSFPLSRMLGKRGLTAIERLSGMLLVVISVNMIMKGFAEFLGK